MTRSKSAGILAAVAVPLLGVAVLGVGPVWSLPTDNPEQAGLFPFLEDYVEADQPAAPARTNADDAYAVLTPDDWAFTGPPPPGGGAQSPGSP